MIKSCPKHACYVVKLISAAGVLFCLWVTAAGAEQVFMGRVASYDPKTGKAVIRFFRGYSQLDRKAQPHNLPDDFREGGTLYFRLHHYKKNTSPISKGRAVRIWGVYDKKSGQFKARRVSVKGFGTLPCDPTGVRRRLEKGCGMFTRTPKKKVDESSSGGMKGGGRGRRDR